MLRRPRPRPPGAFTLIVRSLGFSGSYVCTDNCRARLLCLVGRSSRVHDANRVISSLGFPFLSLDTSVWKPTMRVVLVPSSSLTDDTSLTAEGVLFSLGQAPSKADLNAVMFEHLRCVLSSSNPRVHALPTITMDIK